MYGRVVVPVLLGLVLSACAGGERSPGTNGSGNLVVAGDLIYTKVVGAGCASRTATQSQSQADAGGEASADVVTRSGSGGGSTAAAFAGSLSTDDDCRAVEEMRELLRALAGDDG